MCELVQKEDSFSPVERLNLPAAQRRELFFSTTQLSKSGSGQKPEFYWHLPDSSMIEKQTPTDIFSAHLLVFQVFYLGGVVAVSLAVAEDLEPRHTDGVDHWPAVREKLHVSHL